MPKDNFSTQASQYAQVRPHYPPEVFDFLFSIVEQKKMAWDCATGNGQFAAGLATKFEKVMATDISANQLAHAKIVPNIEYIQCSAEQTPFPNHTFNLITVAQALHWFDFGQFYSEARRVAQPNCLIFIIGYATPRFRPKIDKIVQHFYKEVVGKYWDAERKHIDNHYADIPFPFQEIECPSFNLTLDWNVATAEDYFNSWSSVQHYIKANGENPVIQLVKELKKEWQAFEQVNFPLFTKAGRI